MDARHDFVRRVGAAAEDRDLMLVTGCRQSGITPPAVGVNHRPALHSALDEGKQTVCRDISDLLKADAAKPPAVLLDCYGDDGLALGFSASRTLFRATNIGFINLDRTRQQVPARPDHGAAQLVQPGPGSFVAAKPQFPLEASALTPFFWLVTNHIARNHIRNGLRVPSKIVPAVSDVCLRQARHRSHPPAITHGSPASPQWGQVNP